MRCRDRCDANCRGVADLAQDQHVTLILFVRLLSVPWYHGGSLLERVILEQRLFIRGLVEFYYVGQSWLLAKL